MLVKYRFILKLSKKILKKFLTLTNKINSINIKLFKKFKSLNNKYWFNNFIPERGTLAYGSKCAFMHATKLWQMNSQIIKLELMVFVPM